MTVLRLISVIISMLLLGAHFLRSGHLILALVLVALPAVLWTKKVWAVRLTQLVLVLGAAEWVRTLLILVADRRGTEQPWVRLVAILGGVAVFTLASAVLIPRFGPGREKHGS